MFDSLDEQMKKDQLAESTPTERWLLRAGIAVAAVLLFGGLWIGVRLVS
jgi:hypothetical protein